MPQPQQLSLEFASLDFPDNRTVTVAQIADKLKCTIPHILNLVDDGTLVACDAARRVGSRRMVRVPVEEYRRFVMKRLSGPSRADFVAGLPRTTLVQIREEIDRVLAD